MPDIENNAAQTIMKSISKNILVRLYEEGLKEDAANKESLQSFKYKRDSARKAYLKLLFARRSRSLSLIRIGKAKIICNEINKRYSTPK